MIKKISKQTALIVSAALLLCAISAYRQISIRFFPDDLTRPVIVYFIYLLLLAGWWASILNRVVQRNLRIFLLAEHAVMLLGVTVRFIQDALLYRDISLMRISGYWIVIPFILLPLFGLYGALGLGKSEEYRMKRKWYLLLLSATIFVMLVLTNERHHLIFRLLEDEVQANLYFHPNIGIFVLIAWALSLEIIRLVLIYYRSRRFADNTHFKIVPFLIAFFMLIFNIPYLSGSFVVQYELIEYSVSLFFLEVMVWESCIAVGMVPVNTHYKEVFDQSTVAIQIVDKNGQPYLKSACAPELPLKLFESLKQQIFIRTPEGQELHLHPISGGYTVWKEDFSQTIAVIDKLQKSTKKLEYEGELLSQELKVQSNKTAIREQNQIYNQLTDEIGQQLTLLCNMLANKEQTNDTVALFKKICLIGTYVKRKCNLRLIQLSDGKISYKDLQLCYDELIGCLLQMGVAANIYWSAVEPMDPEFVIFTLDLFEFLLEQENFELHSIQATFSSRIDFSVQVSPCNVSAQMPKKEIQQIHNQNYRICYQTIEHGYRILVHGRRD